LRKTPTHQDGFNAPKARWNQVLMMRMNSYLYARKPSLKEQANFDRASTDRGRRLNLIDTVIVENAYCQSQYEYTNTALGCVGLPTAHVVGAPNSEGFVPGDCQLSLLGDRDQRSGAPRLLIHGFIRRTELRDTSSMSSLNSKNALPAITTANIQLQLQRIGTTT